MTLVPLNELLISFRIVVNIFHFDLVYESRNFKQLLLSLELLLCLFLWFLTLFFCSIWSLWPGCDLLVQFGFFSINSADFSAHELVLGLFLFLINFIIRLLLARGIHLEPLELDLFVSLFLLILNFLQSRCYHVHLLLVFFCKALRIICLQLVLFLDPILRMIDCPFAACWWL